MPKKPAQPKAPMYARLPRETLERLGAYAEAHGMKKWAVVEAALKEYLAKRGA